MIDKQLTISLNFLNQYRSPFHRSPEKERDKILTMGYFIETVDLVNGCILFKPQKGAQEDMDVLAAAAAGSPGQLQTIRVHPPPPFTERLIYPFTQYS